MFPFLLVSQELHHEIISSQGKSVELDSGIYVHSNYWAAFYS